MFCTDAALFLACPIVDKRLQCSQDILQKLAYHPTCWLHAHTEIQSVSSREDCRHGTSSSCECLLVEVNKTRTFISAETTVCPIWPDISNSISVKPHEMPIMQTYSAEDKYSYIDCDAVIGWLTELISKAVGRQCSHLALTPITV
jgi:hypothetical protein